MATYKIKPGNAKITLSINKDILDSYKKYCQVEGLIISKQVEKFMKEEIEKRK